MSKRRLFVIIFVGILSALFVSVINADNTYAGCSDANGLITATGGFSTLGGTGGDDQGVKWACDRSDRERGIVYIYSSMSGYNINTNINLEKGKNGTAYMAGLIHSNKKGRNKNVWAAYIGFCQVKSHCAGLGGEGTDTINWNAVGKGAGNSPNDDSHAIISGVPTAIQRSFAGSNYPTETYAYWSKPTTGAKLTINTEELIYQMCKSGSTLTASQSIKNACGKTSGSYSGTVTLYIHRCWSESFNGYSYGMDDDDTCASSSVHFKLSIKMDDPPVVSQFDNRVVASFGSCTDDSCMTDNAENTVTFTHQVKRKKDDGAAGEVTNNWYAFYNKKKTDNLAPNGDKHGSISLKRSADYTTVHTHNKKLKTLGPGESDSACDAIGTYQKVTNNTVDTSSTFIKNHDCITVTRYSDYAFTGTVTLHSADGAIYDSTTKKYYIDADKISPTFDHTVKRTDSADDTEVGDDWQIWNGKSSSAVSNASTQKSDFDGTVKLKKTKSSNVKTTGPTNVPLEEGKDKKICNTLGFYKTVYHNRNMHEWDKAEGCITVHRYAWYDITGRVVASTSNAVKATLSDGYYWVDADTAPLMFTHQLKSSSTAKKTKFKTSKPATPSTSNDFSVVADYTESTAFAEVDKYVNQHTSPSTTKPVGVSKDTGDKYCQSMTYYSRIREDLDWSKGTTYGSEKTVSDCMQFKRYKTTFTGSSKVYVKEGSNKIDYTGKTEPYTATGTTYPVIVPVVFEHTVKRNNDAHGSPVARSSHIITTLDNHGVRTGDPEGTVIDKDTSGLTAGQSFTEPNTIYVKVYPDQTITLCQQMNYRNEIQGTFNGTADAEKVCVTIKLGVAKCLSKEFGIHNAQNYLRASIYKNDTTTADVVSEVLSTGETSIESWAKPGDQVQFKYEGCAGGEIARQYASSSTATSYDISTDLSGNLFGRTVGLKEADKDKEGNLKYTDTKTVISNASEDPGTGPFSGSYEVTVTSPSGDTDSDRLYSCDSYGFDGMNNVYRIPAYIEGLTEATYRNKCKSEDVGRLSDLGQTIKQTASWTDLWYVNDTVPEAHNGSKQAKVNLNVHVPYNYKTKVTTGGNGGYINPGSERSESIQLQIEGRDNETVDEDGPYDTTSKPTKYQLIEIIINHNYDVYDAAGFDSIVDKNEYFPDTDGTISLDSRTNGLNICSDDNRRGYYLCNKVESSTSGTKYKSGSTHTIATHKITIPDNAVPGTKYCYIAAVWPSDSHKAIWSDESGKYIFDESLSVADNAAGMVEGGYFWHVSGVTCYTVSKRPSIAVLGGDSYAENYISARIQKRSIDGTEAKSRLYGSWTEYGAVAGNSIKGYASGATLWGGSSIISDTPTKRDCAFSSYTFANYNCTSNLSSVDTLGSLNIDTTSSSNPENISDQIKTRYTRTDTGVVDISGLGSTIQVQNNGECTLTTKADNSVEYAKSGDDVNNFACIGDAGAKYSHYKNSGSKTVYIYSGNTSPICLDRGNDTHNAITVVHSDGTLVIGSNIVYGSYGAQYPGETPENGCYPNVYDNLNNLQQSIIIAKKIVIRHDVTHIDSWLVADEIITCDPDTDWAGNVTISQINSKNCNKQLTINGPVMAKNVKLYRTYGADYEGTGNHSASPAEVFNMGSETYLWAANQAQRYSQATTTYARELAPRY